MCEINDVYPVGGGTERKPTKLNYVEKWTFQMKWKSHELTPVGGKFVWKIENYELEIETFSFQLIPVIGIQPTIGLLPVF